MMRLWTIISGLLLVMAGCTPYNPSEALLQQEVSLTWKGNVQVIYDPDSYQLGYSSSNNEYRVYDDRLAYWFTVRCSERPVEEGQHITADVSWTGESRTMKLKGIGMRVEKTDGNGLVWLWSQKERISIVIMNN